MSIVVVRFPATNNEIDVLKAFNNILNTRAILIPHFKYEEIYNENISGIFIPGGFSYGDYIRPGAVAAVSDLMQAVKTRNKEDNIPVMGICNGFQILTEAKMLPGVLLKNISTKFISKWVYIKKKNKINPLTKEIPDIALKIPIAHFEGRYWINESALKKMEENRQILFLYCNKKGDITQDSNPNGSLKNIAGITNEDHNVFGLMPHPERASNELFSSVDGLYILKSFLKLVQKNKSLSPNLIR